jgi:hypothetical protein
VSGDEIYPDLDAAKADYRAGRLDLQGLCEVGEAYAAALASEAAALPDGQPCDLEALAVSCYLRRRGLEALGLRPGESPGEALDRLARDLSAAHELRELEAQAAALTATLRLV